MTSKQMSSRIDKQNCVLISRRDNELVVPPQRGEATKKSEAIFLPEGNLDFAQSLRYASSKYLHTFSSTSLDLGQNQDFNLVKTFI
ncbi:MAG: hypothetical protein KGI60_03485 [Patescibacteria group bacterium]|nr:hypothetical protein [Patescibacteria group bacterium]